MKRPKKILHMSLMEAPSEEKKEALLLLRFCHLARLFMREREREALPLGNQAAL